MNPWLKFALVQAVNLPLTVAGLVVCLSPALAKRSWLWWNDDDGAGPYTGYWGRYYWLAIRNPVDNLKHVKGVATVGGPLLYKTWLVKGKRFYFKAGWATNTGWPVLSAGAGEGYG